MRLAVVIGAVALLLGALPARAQDVAQGAKVYADQKCAMCHSIEGAGNKKGALDGVGAKYSKDDLHAWIVDAKGMTEKTKSERKPPMKNYTLAKDDLDALVAYMASLKKK